MKQKVSISISQDTLLRIKELVDINNSFRNKSHLIELAVDKYLEEVLKDA